MKQNFANLGTRTRESGRIFAHLYHWARKLLLILGAGTDLPANRESTYNPPFPGDSFSRIRLTGGTVLHPVELGWGGVFALIIFVAARD